MMRSGKKFRPFLSRPYLGLCNLVELMVRVVVCMSVVVCNGCIGTKR